jgi:hypothetical protein
MSGDAGERQRPPGVMQYLFAELRQGFQDIRQKVIEEGWFGRVVTAAPVIEVDRSLTQDRDAFYGSDHSPLKAPDSPGERRPSFEELWKPREHDAERSTEHHKGHDIELDR